jgi:hypothetical protein
MRANLVWHYRLLMNSWGHIKWWLFRERPKYEVNDVVLVALRSAIYGSTTLRCRITGVNYRMFALTYDIISQEACDWVDYGTRTYVQPANILMHAPRKPML